MLFKRVAADPNDNYRITEDNGPWMIMAATFSGDAAEEHAQELVQELRREFHLPSYSYEVAFDYSQGAYGRGIDRFNRPIKMKYRNEEIREIAVLVGDYASVDDPSAQKTLEKLKYMKPECLDVRNRAAQGKHDNRSLAAWRLAQQTVQAIAGSDKKNKGPMGHAFVTTNPLLPKEYFAPKGLDPFVVDLNKGLEHSLLECPGRYTVQVAMFRGHVVSDPKAVEAIENGKAMPSKLELAALQAHEMTLALRAKGYEAYEFHDRGASIVTVGSFEQVGTPRADGKIEIDPRVNTILSTFGADRQSALGAPASVGRPKTIVGETLKQIPFDIQPVPVEIPRQNISASYDRANLSLR